VKIALGSLAELDDWWFDKIVEKPEILSDKQN